MSVEINITENVDETSFPPGLEGSGSMNASIPAQPMAVTEGLLTLNKIQD